MPVERLIPMTFFDSVLLLAAAGGGGALNAVAGGGSFLTFPMLLFQGVPAIAANASSAVALWPASLASAGAYRHDIRLAKAYLLSFSVASVAGGILGAQLLLHTSGTTFRSLVPWLLLFVTLVFAFGGVVVKALRKGRVPAAQTRSRASTAAGFLTQLLIATYGGFFGGGMGIMMLATFTALGMENIHAMNGLKNWCAVCINGVAVVTFVAAGVVAWPQTSVMLIGGVAGGYFGASGAKKLNPLLIRRFVIALGLVLSAYFFIQA